MFVKLFVVKALARRAYIGRHRFSRGGRVHRTIDTITRGPEARSA